MEENETTLDENTDKEWKEKAVSWKMSSRKIQIYIFDVTFVANTSV